MTEALLIPAPASPAPAPVAPAAAALPTLETLQSQIAALQAQMADARERSVTNPAPDTRPDPDNLAELILRHGVEAGAVKWALRQTYADRLAFHTHIQKRSGQTEELAKKSFDALEAQ